MKKRRFLFLVVNLTAIFAVVGSTFLPWWLGIKPSDVALSEILPFDFVSNFLNNLSFEPNVLMAIFAGAAIVLLGAILAFKWVVLLGLAVNIATAILWWLSLGADFVWNDFGHGIYVLAFGVLLSAASLFIPRRRRARRGEY